MDLGLRDGEDPPGFLDAFGRGLAGPLGAVADEFVWAALDCPAGWTTHADSVAVLGRMATWVKVPVESGRRFVVAAWPLGRRHPGRRLHPGR